MFVFVFVFIFFNVFPCNISPFQIVNNIEGMKNISFRNDVMPLKNKLYRLALRITLNNAEAEDIVQETMIKVWNKREQWDEIESIEAYCLTVCRNLALDKAKAAENNNEALDENSYGNTPDVSYSSNPEQQAMDNDHICVVRQLINLLPEKQRTVVQLRDIEGKTYREISVVMGISEDQVKVNLFRARQTIKKKFSETDSYGL